MLILSGIQKERALCAAFGDVQTEQFPDRRVMASVDGYFNTAEGRMPIYAFGGTKEEAVSGLFDFVASGAKEHGGRGRPSVTSCVYTDEGMRVVARGGEFRLKDKSASSKHYKPRR